MELLLYHSDGKTLTPFGILTGTFNDIYDIYSLLNNIRQLQQQAIQPKNNPNRLNWLNYSPEDQLLTNHYNYLMETHSFSTKESNILILAENNNTEIYVFDETYHGFTFKRPSFLQLKGSLSHMFIIAENSIELIDGVIEEQICLDPKLNCCTIEVINGSLLVFICDYQTFYILPTIDCHYKMKIPVIDHGNDNDDGNNHNNDGQCSINTNNI
uniref:Uncharacterized protein LOC113798426 n=1 Tax=Dermatophagoides pteronyssinus TaxID=6956 RepID=A0A6P6YGW9_DERPT